MATINKLQGVDVVLRNLRDRSARMALGCSRGLITAGLALQRESQLLTPVEFGNLKASAFTRPSGSGFRTVVIVGYTASYALVVHEQVGMVLKGKLRAPSPPHQGRYWDPQGRAQAKFLEEPFRRFRPELIRIMKGAILAA